MFQTRESLLYFFLGGPAVVLLLSIVVSLTCTVGMLVNGCELQDTNFRLPVASSRLPVFQYRHALQISEEYQIIELLNY